MVNNEIKSHEVKLHRTTPTRFLVKTFNKELSASEKEKRYLSNLGFRIMLVLFGSPYRRRQFRFSRRHKCLVFKSEGRVAQ